MTLAVPRRSFLGSAAGALALPGCTVTTPRPHTAAAVPPSACLPKVDVSPDRVIRTVAGLRPYRAGGFVVRAEQQGARKIVHNYGHGGAGITLSWGTSRLAADLGLPGHTGAVAVIGAGVMGLATARLVQEAGFPVTLYADKLPPETASNIAGGQFHPYGHFEEASVTAEWRAQYARALDYSWRRFQIMVGEDYGIRWLPTYNEGEAPEQRLTPNFPPVNRLLTRAEHPFPFEHLIRFDTLYVETGRYLRQMLRDVQAAGGQVRIRRFEDRAALDALPERLIFNCTGLGARTLFGDTELRPVRGQLAILLPQPEIRYALNSSRGYMFPRADGILLGGSWEMDEWLAEPQPQRIAGILQRQAAIFGGWRC